MLVADVDTEEAAALYLKLAGDYPDTPVAQTKNGLHVWYFAPGANGSVWIGGRTLLFKGLGGYVVAPPSKHLDDETGEVDGVYTWLHPLLMPEGHMGQLEVLPAAFEEAIVISQAFVESRREQNEKREKWRIGVEFKPGGGFVLRKEWEFEGLLRAVVEAEDGNQNNVIHWAACTMRDEGVPFEVAMKHLMQAALDGHHPKERARDTIKGAYKRRARG